MHKAKSSGPRTDPCGTPHFTSHIEESTPFITVNCFLLPRYDIKKLFACPRIPYLSNMSSNISWTTVSNAFVRSMKILMAQFPSSRMLLILSVNSISLNVVECSLRNPNWKSNNILFTSRNFRKVFCTISFQKFYWDMTANLLVYNYLDYISRPFYRRL